MICVHCGHKDHRGNEHLGVQNICMLDDCSCNACVTEKDLVEESFYVNKGLDIDSFNGA